jgi:hypothetical protein
MQCGQGDRDRRGSGDYAVEKNQTTSKAIGGNERHEDRKMSGGATLDVHEGIIKLGM